MEAEECGSTISVWTGAVGSVPSSGRGLRVASYSHSLPASVRAKQCSTVCGREPLRSSESRCCVVHTLCRAQVRRLPKGQKNLSLEWHILWAALREVISSVFTFQLPRDTLEAFTILRIKRHVKIRSHRRLPNATYQCIQRVCLPGFRNQHFSGFNPDV